MVREETSTDTCGAATNPSCATDQMNALAPLMPTAHGGPAIVRVTRDGLMSASFIVHHAKRTPTFLSFDIQRHVAARPLDSSLVGPTDFYPRYTTPAKLGETTWS
jgi:hypothetical protein